MALAATSRLYIDGSFAKQVPLEHPYIRTLFKHEAFIAGPNQVTIGLRAKNGTIYSPEFLATLRKATDDVFFLPGVNRTTLRSLWTPNVRYTISVEGGLEANPVIPPAYTPTSVGVELVRRNVLRADLIGSLVSRDASATLIVAELRDKDPQTGLPVDYVDTARRLEEIRARYAKADVDVHIIGYAPLVGAIVSGGQMVLLFFGVSVLVTLALVRWYAGAWKPTLMLLLTSASTVIWQLGLTGLVGGGLNPLSAIVPFLIFAISVSHGIQVVSMQLEGLREGLEAVQASRRAFRQLWAPGMSALAANVVGFGTLLLIPVGVIRDIALMAILGLAAVSICKLTTLPLLLTWVRSAPTRPDALREGSAGGGGRLWRALARTANPRVAAGVVAFAVLLGAGAFFVAQHRIVGDTQEGASELRSDSTYNADVRAIVSRFDLSSDVLVVVATGKTDACLDYDTMRHLDRMAATLSATPGVRSVVSLASAVKGLNAAWAEGNPKHYALQRGEGLLALSVDYVPAGTGLRSLDCKVMPIYVFASDHKAETITRLIDTVKTFAHEHPGPLQFELAAGPLGVSAAVNETVVSAQWSMLLWVFLSVAVVSWLGLQRSWRATVVVLLPLVLVTVLADALMVVLDIGLKVATLPVAALGVGIGVDYGVYIFSRFQQARSEEGLAFLPAYQKALSETGRAVIFTGATLSISVATWAFSPLRYQADLGIMLTVMFVFSMLGAIVVSPALARFLYWREAGANPSFRDDEGSSVDSASAARAMEPLSRTEARHA
ncbi:MMPL family transporter [Variovorax sp. J22P271]|uniref:efflux RND transporter permease subunit n=1 Tax=Variovorax davisae TaxID=3053515 RepID=UPI0025765472|nr:MMPL family transporter [Variovorax sp. J22P271]MDM0032394.1 MMPL family transporter [Variovorax sp. J22P271]